MEVFFNEESSRPISRDQEVLPGYSCRRNYRQHW